MNINSNYNSITEKHSVWEIMKDLHIQSQTQIHMHASCIYMIYSRQSSRPNPVTHSGLQLGEGSLIRSELTPPPQHPVRAVLNNVEEPEWYRKCSLFIFGHSFSTQTKWAASRQWKLRRHEAVLMATKYHKKQFFSVRDFPQPLTWTNNWFIYLSIRSSMLLG